MRAVSLLAATVLASACGGGAAGEAVDEDLPDVEREVPGERASSNAGASGVASASGSAVDQLDLLLMIDNSLSMSDKQQILSTALPELMGRLVNPPCVDEQGNLYPLPEGVAGCPAGQRREFQPMADVHVGIISSSLGDVGANVACPAQPNHPVYAPDRVDMAHLLGSLERSTAATHPQGFLEWRAGSTSASEFNDNFARLVTDVGERGCGWEAQLESWYRFLVDPVPYRELVRVPCSDGTSSAANCVRRATDSDGRFLLDETLLDQRDAFLRPDSLVVIVMVTDENDCSMQVGGQSWVLLSIDDTRPTFRGSAACAEDPNSRCCHSCAFPAPSGCPIDPGCSSLEPGGSRLLPELDGHGLRCFDQKRRFGADFLYPTQRYVNALTQAQLCWSAPDLALDGCDERDVYPNPLFVGGRAPERVLLAGIVGVPPQALDAGDGAGAAGAPGAFRFRTYEELGRDGVWDQILGSAAVAGQPRQGLASGGARQPCSTALAGADGGEPVASRGRQRGQSAQRSRVRHRAGHPERRRPAHPR